MATSKRGVEVLELVLSPNDAGETGSHQAGILVPKDPEILSFFPLLSADEKNPRAVMNFVDPSGVLWSLRFIYYNNRHFGGTRDEYRLTRLTGFIKSNSLRSGDSIILARDEDGTLQISAISQVTDNSSSGKLVLRYGWKRVRLTR